MNWKNFFPEPALLDGRDFFNGHMIINLRRGPAAWQAEIVSAEVYSARAALNGGERPDTRCSCPRGRAGRHCSHVAALLFALEDFGACVIKDDISALNRQLDQMSPEEARTLLALASDLGQARCAAALMARLSGEGAAPADEFSLDEAPGGDQDRQGDNGPMKLLFPDGR